MVSSLFALFGNNAITPNGKVEREALPEPEDNIKTSNEYVVPRNGT